jgi:1-acyl-sn-glycerol-3-phosphate acyltransferase
VLRSLLAWTISVPATGALGALVVLQSRRHRWHHRIPVTAQRWGRLCLAAGGVRMSVEGLAGFNLEQSYVIMANHQSALDIPALLAATPVSLGLCFISKSSLFSIPVLGRAMQALGYVSVDRDDPREGPRVLADALARLRQGRSVLVFPEGTYSRDGTLLPFRKGAFLLALRSRAPVLPVGIVGSREVLPPRTRALKGDTIIVRFGAPIATAGLGPRQLGQLSETCRHSIAKLSSSG